MSTSRILRTAAPVVEFAFHVAILTCLGLYLLDAVFPTAVSPFLPLGSVVVTTGVLGILSAALSGSRRAPVAGRAFHPLRSTLTLGGIGAIGAVLLWASLREVGPAALGLTVLAVVLVIILFLVLGRDPEEPSE